MVRSGVFISSGLLKVGSFMGRWVRFAVSFIVLLFALDLAFNGVSVLPALGSTFNPGVGVWTVAAQSALPQTGTFNFASMPGQGSVVFAKSGVPSLQSSTVPGLFFEEGVVQARFRLFEMDLFRREGSGELSQLLGASALPTDRLELELGLRRTAVADWSLVRRNDPTVAKDIIAFTNGINAEMTALEHAHALPVQFKLLGYAPKPWTPVDTFVIEGDLTQMLDYSLAPIDYALLVKSLGYRTAMTLYPVIAPDHQSPYDVGPYTKLPPAPIPQRIPDTSPGPALQGSSSPPSATKGATSATLASYVRSSGGSSNLVKASLALLSQASRQLPYMISLGPNSNNWAVEASRTASGHALLAGDPHLEQRLPAIWYQLSAVAPGLRFSGVSVPGLPGVLIGTNGSIAWSETNTQNQSTMFYHEVTLPSRPNEYFWRGGWHAMHILHYKIPVRRVGYVPFTVRLSVHGPILTQEGATLSVDWTGAVPNLDIASLMGIFQAKNFSEFRSALSTWSAPTQNFVFADDHGNVGLISAGLYPIVNAARPWLPLDGSGSEDIVGTIPYSQIPHAYDPPTGYVFSANQREVLPRYPYFIGTSLDFFANGYRADTINAYLAAHPHMTVAQMVKLQGSVFDSLAAEIVPKIRAAIAQYGATNGVSAARLTSVSDVLGRWNDQMTVHSTAASIWWLTWTNYLTDVFGPLWARHHVPASRSAALKVGPQSAALDEVLEAATLAKTSTLPSVVGQPSTTLPALLDRAVAQATSSLTHRFGAVINTWQWGRLHTRYFPSLTKSPGLGYGPRASSGDLWTVNAADGGLQSSQGPSWRMIVEPGVEAKGVYPGGQSENPLSPWYENEVNTWWNLHYIPVAFSTAPNDRLATWTIRP
jgi:penicillin amidase